MNTIDPQAASQLLQAQLQPWHYAVVDPIVAQEQVLHSLLMDYARTRYGKQHGADQIETFEEYRRAFPVKTYDQFKPMIEQVMSGDIELLLAEEPVGWAITRGTTSGESKSIPMTPELLEGRISAGRGMM